MINNYILITVVISGIPTIIVAIILVIDILKDLYKNNYSTKTKNEIEDIRKFKIIIENKHKIVSILDHYSFLLHSI